MQYDENAEKYGYEGEMILMKCEELQSVYIDRTGDWARSDNNTGKFYLKSEVDEAIVALKDAWRNKHAACEVLKAKLETVNELVKTSKDMHDRTIESLKASHYAEMVDAGMRERRLLRALYKACANWAHAELMWASFIDFKFPETWYNMENKCLNKAELYK